MAATVKFYCRLCADLKSDDKLVDLGQISPKLLRLNQPFIAVEDLSMPQKVCFVCIQSLDFCLEFIDNLEKAQTTLSSIFTKKYTEDVPSDADDIVNEDWPPPYEYQIFVKEDKKSKKVKTKKKKTRTKKSSESPTKSVKREKSVPKIRFRFESNSNSDSETDYVELNNIKSWDMLQWTCSVCETSFPSRAELVSHSTEYHKNCSTYKCPGCVKKFLKLETFVHHVRKFHSAALRLSCHICNGIFTSTRQRVDHQQSHSPIPFSCSGCVATFSTKEELDQHILTYYQDGRALRFYKVSEKINIEPICTICDKKYANKIKLKQHMQIHKPKQPNICERCGKTFANKNNLLNHMLVHDDRKDHKCSLCPSSFRSASNLKDHMIRHKGEKNHSCSECGKTFLFRNQLKTHLTIHSDNFPFKCDHCDKSFRLNAQLKRHLRQHTGYKPYKCQVCERLFTDWPNYNKHMVRKHNIDTSKTKRTPYGVIRLSHIAPHLPVGNAMADLVERHVQGIANSEASVENDVKLESQNESLDT